MKILHVINNLSSGGAENLLKEIVPIQNEINQVSILTLSNKNNVFEKTLKECGVKVINTQISNNVYNPLQILEICNIIKNYDLIHVHLFPSLYWVALSNTLLFKLKKKLVATEHNTTNNRRNKIIFKYLDRYIYSKYDNIICISNETKKELSRWIDGDDNCLTVINNGINVSKFKNSTPVSKKSIFINYKENDILLLMVARFNAQKDHETLIKSLEILPSNYKLILIGEGKRLDIIKQMVNELELTNRVVFLGFRSDIDKIMKTCDINILSSHYEGFGLSALESMASGTPTIVSNVPGLSNIVGEGAILFKKGDYKDLANKILFISNNEDAYHEMCIKGYKESEKYDLIKMIKLINNIYIGLN